MTHAWLNLLAVLFSGLMGSTDTATNHFERTEYAVIERISDIDATIETATGNITVPLALLPRMERMEGEVIEIRKGKTLEIRVAEEERNRRLASGNARLRRMKEATTTSEL